MAEIRYSECCFLSFPKDGYRLTWEVTQFCPYSCEYCFTWSSPQREKFECNINAIIKKLQDFVTITKVRDILITGGEPLCVIDEITPLVTYIKKRGITFSVSSNLYDKNRVLKLCNLRPRAINLSVDPPTLAASHTIFKSTYDEIDKKISITKMHGIPVKLNAVINRSNYTNVQILIEFLTRIIKKHRNIRKIAFIREYPIGHAAGSKHQTKSELMKTHSVIVRWAKNIKVEVTMVNWDIFSTPLQECKAAKNLVSVMPNGDVTPCSLLYNLSRSFRIGNLLKDDIKDIVERQRIFSTEIDKYNQLTAKNTPACRTCNLTSKCGGGCPAVMPIASNHISRRTCGYSPRRLFDHERKLLADFHQNLRLGYSPDSHTFAKPSGELSGEQEQQIRDYVQRNMKPSDLAHTMEHIDCVVSLAKYISKAEGASLKITVAAAYFHDISSRQPAMHHMHTFKSALIASSYLSKTGLFSMEEINHIQYCIYTSSYGSYLLGYRPLSLEAKVVRDADWLDAIGARGIARVFAFGQAHGAKSVGYTSVDPEGFLVSVDMNITGPDKDPITHFFTKLLKIKMLLQTETARKLAESRHQLMVEFLRQYIKEMDVGKERNHQFQLKFLHKKE